MLSCVVAAIENSARAQHSASPFTGMAGHDPFPRPTPCSSLQLRFSGLRKPRLPRPARRGGRLIANPRLRFALTNRKRSRLRISNRERIAIFSPAAPCELRASPLGFSIFSALRLLASDLQFLIVTSELEFRATRRKQTPNPISNRYKTGFSIRLFRSSFQPPELRYNEP
jgi:hypothetical protein